MIEIYCYIYFCQIKYIFIKLVAIICDLFLLPSLFYSPTPTSPSSSLLNHSLHLLSTPYVLLMLHLPSTPSVLLMLHLISCLYSLCSSQLLRNLPRSPMPPPMKSEVDIQNCIAWCDERIFAVMEVNNYLIIN